MAKLTKIPLPDTHTVNGNEFPVAYKIEADESFLKDTDAVSDLLKKAAQENFFSKTLLKNGALVIRNTGTTDPEVLSKYIRAIGDGSGDIYFNQRGSTAKRTEVTTTLSTANEGPSSNYIHQHNEFSRFIIHPTRLFFVCSQFGPETKGGETPIVHGAEYFNNLKEKAPELIDRLAKDGLYYEQTWFKTTNDNTNWGDYFCFGREIKDNDSYEQAKKKAEELVNGYVSHDYHWTENDDLVVGQHTEPIRVHKDPETGKEHPTIFSSVATYYYHGSVDTNYSTPTKPLLYDNGTGEEINPDWLQKALDISVDISYKHKWEEGDIALVDNYQVSHGRCPWSDGPRKILVSMWDTPGKEAYKIWTP